ncbi:MAG: hypothetical protein ETSY2_48095 [Candidatus Entotheonella gemina]|uniref:CheR-type methyltransferase domain-containing protein n=2 Tax=Candidatus Entotheonella TaxID=93171 RepID=W4LBV0_9BACT|nr:MAG: hypothetical protein ETSY2_48095 [Candidatus Entotheonella gemina]
MLHFAPHNLLDDPPFTHVSLVSCRNCLIYLETVVQQRILACFANALGRQGYLWLGPSESCGSLSSVFRTVHAKWQIYRKVRAVKSLFDTECNITQRVYSPEQELAYTKGYLRTTIAELESTRKQLQSSNEALVAAREELQLTKEELQSVYEELHMVTVESQKKIRAFSQLNHDIDNPGCPHEGKHEGITEPGPIEG